MSMIAVDRFRGGEKANIRLYRDMGYEVDREEASGLGIAVHMSKPVQLLTRLWSNSGG